MQMIWSPLKSRVLCSIWITDKTFDEKMFTLQLKLKIIYRLTYIKQIF